MTNNISEESEYSSLTDEERITAIYGSPANFILIMCQRMIDKERAKVLSYLNEPNLPERMKQVYQDTLEEMDNYERNLRQKAISND